MFFDSIFFNLYILRDNKAIINYLMYNYLIRFQLNVFYLFE